MQIHARSFVFLGLLVIFLSMFPFGVAGESSSPIRWEPLCEPGCDGWIVSIGVNPHRSREILLGGDLLGVGRTENHGELWKPCFGLKCLEMGDFTFHPSDPDIVWVGTMGGPYMSSDGGKTWQERRQGFPETSRWFYTAPIEKVLYDPGNSKHLLAFGGNSRRYMMQAESKFGSVWESLDHGDSWTEITVIPPAPEIKSKGANIVGAGFAAGSGRILYIAAEFRGILRSDDGGKTFLERNEGLPHKNIERIVMHPVKPETFWVCLNSHKPKDSSEAISGSIFRSDDGGKTYTEIVEELPNRNHENPLFAANYKGFAVSRSNPDVMYVSDSAWNGCKIYRSIDGGKHWESVLEKRGGPEPVEKTVDAAYFIGPAMTVLAIDPIDENIVYAAGAEYAVRTLDGGKTWTDITSKRTGNGWSGRGYSGLCSMNFRFDPFRKDRAILLAMDAGKCWESTDGLKSWVYRGRQPNPWGGGNDASFSKDGRLYTSTGQFGSHAAILRSEKENIDWTPLFGPERGLPPNEGAGIATGVYTLPDDSLKVWAVLGETLFYSENSGETWKKISGEGGLPDEPYGWLSGDPNRPNRFYVSGKSEIFVTENGNTFENIGGPRVPGRMSVDSMSRLYLAAYRGERPGLWRFDPESKIWTRLKDDWHLSNLAIDPNDPDRIMVIANDDPYHDHVDSSGVSISSDGGKTWSEQNFGLPLTRGHAIAFDPFDSERVVCGTLGCGFFVAKWPNSYKPKGSVRYEHDKDDTLFAAVRAGAKNMLKNGSMSLKQKDGIAPENWSESWGDVVAYHDDKLFMKGPGALRVEPKEAGKSGQVFQMFEGHAGKKFRIFGYVKSQGNVKVNVAVQAFDNNWTKNEFLQIKYLQGTIDWARFDKEITIPEWSARFNVLLLIEGDGRAWLDEIVLIPAGEKFDEKTPEKPEGVDETADIAPAEPKIEIPKEAVYENPWTPCEGFFSDYPDAWKRFHDSFLERIKASEKSTSFSSEIR